MTHTDLLQRTLPSTPGGRPPSSPRCSTPTRGPAPCSSTLPRVSCRQCCRTPAASCRVTGRGPLPVSVGASACGKGAVLYEHAPVHAVHVCGKGAVLYEHAPVHAVHACGKGVFYRVATQALALCAVSTHTNFSRAADTSTYFVRLCAVSTRTSIYLVADTSRYFVRVCLVCCEHAHLYSPRCSLEHFTLCAVSTIYV